MFGVYARIFAAWVYHQTFPFDDNRHQQHDILGTNERQKHTSIPCRKCLDAALTPFTCHRGCPLNTNGEDLSSVTRVLANTSPQR